MELGDSTSLRASAAAAPGALGARGGGDNGGCAPAAASAGRGSSPRCVGAPRSVMAADDAERMASIASITSGEGGRGRGEAFALGPERPSAAPSEESPVAEASCSGNDWGYALCAACNPRGSQLGQALAEALVARASRTSPCAEVTPLWAPGAARPRARTIERSPSSDGFAGASGAAGLSTRRPPGMWLSARTTELREQTAAGTPWRLARAPPPVETQPLSCAAAALTAETARPRPSLERLNERAAITGR